MNSGNNKTNQELMNKEKLFGKPVVKKNWQTKLY